MYALAVPHHQMIDSFIFELLNVVCFASSFACTRRCTLPMAISHLFFPRKTNLVGRNISCKRYTCGCKVLHTGRRRYNCVQFTYVHWHRLHTTHSRSTLPNPFLHWQRLVCRCINRAHWKPCIPCRTFANNSLHWVHPIDLHSVHTAIFGLSVQPV